MDLKEKLIQPEKERQENGNKFMKEFFHATLLFCLFTMGGMCFYDVFRLMVYLFSIENTESIGYRMSKTLFHFSTFSFYMFQAYKNEEECDDNEEENDYVCSLL